MNKWPLHREEVESLIWMNNASQIVIDSRLIGWKELMVFVEDNIIDTSNYHDDGTPGYSEDIDWNQVWEDYDEWLSKNDK